METFSNRHEQKTKKSDVIEHDTDKTGKADWIMSQETSQNGWLWLDFPWTKVRLMMTMAVKVTLYKSVMQEAEQTLHMIGRDNQPGEDWPVKQGKGWT